MRTKLTRIIGCSLLFLALAACGGSDDGGGVAPAPAPPAGIGPAGGTVTGSNGATVVVPPGALSQTVNLQITEISPGSATLPASAERVGAIYALTPHGTTFAAPVTVTVPFDPALLSAGRTAHFLKTTDAARTLWAPVAGAAISGTSVRGQLTSFSDLAPVLVPTAPAISAQPSSVAISVGQSATFSVVAAANGGAFLTYQWQRNGVSIPGATGARYTLTNAIAGDNAAEFSVVVDNGVGTVTSSRAVLTVNAAPVAGWVTLGSPVSTAGPVRLGGLAVSASGRVAVSYVAGSSGIAGLVGEVRVSEWDGSSWTQVGGALNITANDGPSLASRSIAYDRSGRPVIAWLDRFSLALVVQRWNGMAWERLGNPLFQAAAATADPQIAVDPVSDRPIVVITSGPHVSAREWTGSDWAPLGPTAVATSLTGAILAVLNTGQRLLAVTYGDDPGGVQLLARLLAPNVSGQYVTQVGGAISTPFAASNFFLDLATDGASPFALIGHQSAGPMLMRRWSGTAWEAIGGDLAIRNFGGLAQLRVTPFGLPLVAYRQGASPSRRVDGLWWDGTSWNSVVSPNAATVDVIGFALGVARSGLPYVALTQRDPTNPSQLATELVVRRFTPVTLSVVVSGPAGSGTVNGGSQTCPVATTCDLSLPAGATVVLDAAPAAGFNLQSWTGCDAVAALRCMVTVSQNRTVTATLQ